MSAGSASPLVDPVISPEYPVADLAIRSAANGQAMPSIAYDGTNYLVVWSDGRIDNGSIYGARVAPDGTVLDIGGIQISNAPNEQVSPDVAFDGTNYLVTWSDRRRDYTRWDVYGARVTPGGTVLDPGGIPIATEPYFDQKTPRIAFDGANYLVVWTDSRNWPDVGDVFGARVTPGGTVLEPQGFPIYFGPNGQFAGGIEFDGKHYLVSWTDQRHGSGDVYAGRVTPAGGVLDPQGIPVSTAPGAQSASDVAFDGTNSFVVWEDGRSGSGSMDVYGARVKPEGVVIDTDGIPISTAPSHQEQPRVAFDGTNYLVAWEDIRSSSSWDVYSSRVSRSGGVLDEIKVSDAANNQMRPVVASDGTNFMVAWDDNGGSADTYGARVTGDGVLLDPNGIVVSNAYAGQSIPALAYNGTNYLVVWNDDRGGSGPTGGAEDDVFAARVTEGGTRLDGTGIAVATAPSFQGWADVASDGTNYLVAWSDYRNPLGADIYGARVTAAGQVLDPNGFPISEAPGYQLTPKVAFDGTNYLVGWTDTRSDDGDVYAARVSQAGTVLDPAGIAVSAENNSQGLGALTFAAGDYFLAWGDSRAVNYASDAYGARMTPSGDVLDPAGIPISTAAGDQYPSGVAFDGADFLVAWAVDLNEGQDDVYAARVTQGGGVLEPAGLLVPTASGSEQAPTVATSEGGFLVVWTDSRGGNDDLYAARVNGFGTVLDPAGLLVGSAVGDFVTARAVASPGGRVAVAYHRKIDLAPPLGTTRSEARRVDPGRQLPPPPPPPPPIEPPPPSLCHVPKVVGLRLAQARFLIRRLKCSVGRVRRVRARPRRVGRVLGQTPRPGRTGPRGLRVNLVVGRR